MQVIQERTAKKGLETISQQDLPPTHSARMKNVLPNIYIHTYTDIYIYVHTYTYIYIYVHTAVRARGMATHKHFFCP